MSDAASPRAMGSSRCLGLTRSPPPPSTPGVMRSAVRIMLGGGTAGGRGVGLAANDSDVLWAGCGAPPRVNGDRTTTCTGDGGGMTRRARAGLAATAVVDTVERCDKIFRSSSVRSTRCPWSCSVGAGRRCVPSAPELARSSSHFSRLPSAAALILATSPFSCVQCAAVLSLGLHRSRFGWATGFPSKRCDWARSSPDGATFGGDSGGASRGSQRRRGRDGAAREGTGGGSRCGSLSRPTKAAPRNAALPFMVMALLDRASSLWRCPSSAMPAFWRGSGSASHSNRFPVPRQQAALRLLSAL